MIEVPNYESFMPLPSGTYSGTYTGAAEPFEYEKNGEVRYKFTLNFTLQPQQNVSTQRKFEGKFFDGKRLVDACIKAGMEFRDGKIIDDPHRNQPFKLNIALSKDKTDNFLNSFERIR